MTNLPGSARIRHLSGPVWVSGQVEPEQLQDIADAGFAWLVNHRPDGEEPLQPSGGDVRRAAESAGLTVVEAPVRGLPDETAIRATAAVLVEAGDAKVLMFCRSGMRSAAAWALASRAAGAEPDALRAAAAKAGYDLARLPL